MSTIPSRFCLNSADGYWWVLWVLVGEGLEGPWYLRYCRGREWGVVLVEHVSELRWVLMVVEVLEHVDGVVGFGECGRERMRKLVAVKGEALVGTGMASLVAWKLD